MVSTKKNKSGFYLYLTLYDMTINDSGDCHKNAFNTRLNSKGSFIHASNEISLYRWSRVLENLLYVVLLFDPIKPSISTVYSGIIKTITVKL